VLGHDPVPVGDDLIEVVPGVHMQQWNRQRCREERPARQVQHHDRIFAAGEEQHGTLELGDRLPDDVHRLGFQRVEVADSVDARHRWRVGRSKGRSHR
jgi:hypothetical protein